MYEAYIFDLYGTLVDIHTDEEQPYLWEKMSELYGAMGAVYEPEELQEEMRRLEAEQKELMLEELVEKASVNGKMMSLQKDAEEDRTQLYLANQELDEADRNECPQILVEPDLTQVFMQLYKQKDCPMTEEIARMTAITFRALSREYLRVYPGVKETLAELRRRGKRVYLLSNAQRDFTCPELEMLGLTRLFDGILISSVEGVKKPSKLFFDRLLARYGLDPKKCLMVGNEEKSDILGAIRAGMDSLYIHTDISPKDVTDSRATYCVMSGGFEKAAELYLLKDI